MPAPPQAMAVTATPSSPVSRPVQAEETPIVVEALPDLSPPVRPPNAGSFTGKQLPGWLLAWRKIGGGSLTASLLIHVGLLFAAGLVVVVTQGMEKRVDFLPGGGTQQGALASSEMQHQVQQKSARR
ncbi:MAG: hypothetical protein V4672_08135 [Verrucomicrobiota bacterium]